MRYQPFPPLGYLYHHTSLPSYTRFPLHLQCSLKIAKAVGNRRSKVKTQFNMKRQISYQLQFTFPAFH